MESRNREPDLVEEVADVRVAKYLDEERYELPSVIYEIESERTEPVTVSIREPIPESVPFEHIGFHRDKGADHWEVDDGALSFEYTLKAGERFTTVYAIRTDSTVAMEDLLVQPESIDVEPDGSTVPEPTAMTRSSTHAPYDASTQTPHGDTDEGEEPATDELESAEETVDSTGHDGSSDRRTNDESLLDELAREIQAGDASADSLDTLQEHLHAGGHADGAIDARVRQLQEDVSNLRAYKNALETFLEEEGSAQEIIDAFENRLDAVEGDLESLRTSVGELETRADTFESNLRQLESDLETTSSGHDELESEVESLADDLDSIDERVPSYAIDERFADLEAELETVGEFVENLRTAFE